MKFTNFAGLLATLLPLALVAQQTQTPPPAALPAPAETIEVTSTRMAEPVAEDPALVTVITGDELRDRGATDLQSALALAAGVDIAPGGDSGPASSVPEFWGLREFDAFLLVVDGVPWGGAFNPALTTLDLTNVERIEVLRGGAPVSYGATSFVGVIQVIHKAPEKTETVASASVGNTSSGSLGFSMALPAWGKFKSAIAVDGRKEGFADDRTGWKRAHLAWRGGVELGSGKLSLSLDGSALRQSPASPHPRAGTILDPNIPLDANHNPADAYVNERRWSLASIWAQPLWNGEWATTLSVSRNDRNNLRGFLIDPSGASPDANGFRQSIHVTDIYFDTHFAFHPAANFKMIAGLDHLHGQGTMKGGDFDYDVGLDGSNAPSSDALPAAADIRLSDMRDFSGLYTAAEWRPLDRLLVEGGIRLNRSAESREASHLDYASGTLDYGVDRKTVTRGSGALGITVTAWKEGNDALRFFTAYKNTYKPGAVDFGVDSAADILQPETAESYELGMKSRVMNGRLSFDLAFFQMDFRNLVVSQADPLTGLPVLVNAGASRFRGRDLEISWSVFSALHWFYSDSQHDSRFRDYVQDFGGTPTQLKGKRIEMTPHSIEATGFTWAPKTGFIASAQAQFIGDRFMNKRNTALADAYTTWGAGIGWRGEHFEIRLDGRNLSNQRPPVSESEVGDAQYYRLPARRVDLRGIWKF